MGTETLAIGSGRTFRYALGSLLLLASMTLLGAQGLVWLDLEPKLMRALQGGAICALGTLRERLPVAMQDVRRGLAAVTLPQFDHGVRGRVVVGPRAASDLRALSV